MLSLGGAMADRGTLSIEMHHTRYSVPGSAAPISANTASTGSRLSSSLFTDGALCWPLSSMEFTDWDSVDCSLSATADVDKLGPGWTRRSVFVVAWERLKIAQGATSISVGEDGNARALAVTVSGDAVGDSPEPPLELLFEATDRAFDISAFWPVPSAP